MKQVTKERTDKYIAYEALDGTAFRDKAECEKYEESAKCVIRAKIAKLTVGKENAWTLIAGYDDHDIIGIDMHTEKDMDTLKQFACLECSWYSKERLAEIFDIIEKAYDNKDIVLFGINVDGDYYWINSRQNIIDNLMNLTKEEKE